MQSKYYSVFSLLYSCIPSFVSSGPQYAIELPAPVHLVSHLVTAVNASVFILVTLRQNEEQEFPHRNRLPALGAV